MREGRKGRRREGREEGRGRNKEGGRRERTQGVSSLKLAKQKSRSLVINYIDIKYTLKESMLK